MKRALISVSDKTNIQSFCRQLIDFQFEIVSTGGTYRVLKEANIPVIPIEEITHRPEAFDGRMKTISFEIGSALLYRRQNAQDVKEAQELGIQSIDLVVCNLYPFDQARKEKKELDELIEFIDIGGPTMIRAAAKNYHDVSVLVDHHDYASYIESLKTQKNDLKLRQTLAVKAFSHTAAYDNMVAKELSQRILGQEVLAHCLSSSHQLRYGENPHQAAHLFTLPEQTGIAQAQVLQGKELSYNNYLDADAAWRCVSDLHQLNYAPFSVCVVKHLNPCGAAQGQNQLETLQLAWQGDPVSAFGSILAFNHQVDASCAQWLREYFVEVIIAPSFSPEALEIFGKKKNLRLLTTELYPSGRRETMIRSIGGGLLMQQEDEGVDQQWKEVTEKCFDENQKKLALFGVMVTKHLKSNGIGLVGQESAGMSLIGAGMGQPNRLDSLLKLAIPRMKEKKPLPLILISDAFFPFSDCVEAAHEAGIHFIVQPGGSIRDEEVIAKANELGVAMSLTSRRHFRH